MYNIYSYIIYIIIYILVSATKGQHDRFNTGIALSEHSNCLGCSSTATRCGWCQKIW